MRRKHHKWLQVFPKRKSANPLIPFEPDQQAEILQQHPQIQMQMILDVAPPKQQKDRFLKDDYRWIPESASYRSNHAFHFPYSKHDDIQNQYAARK